jgi:hypothetical protein
MDGRGSEKWGGGEERFQLVKTSLPRQTSARPDSRGRLSPHGSWLDSRAAVPTWFASEVRGRLCPRGSWLDPRAAVPSGSLMCPQYRLRD